MVSKTSIDQTVKYLCVCVCVSALFQVCMHSPDKEIAPWPMETQSLMAQKPQVN